MKVNASCNQCGHQFTKDEIYSVCITGECPTCGCGGSVEGDSVSGLFTYDPKDDYKTEQ